MYTHVFYMSIWRLKGFVQFAEEAFKQEEEICHNCFLSVALSVGSSAGESVVTKAESNQSGESLLPETAQLLSSLSSIQPKIFAQLQVQSSCLKNVKRCVLGMLKAS